MLTSTFLHAPGIGGSTERKLWKAGVLTWESALTTPRLPLGEAQRRALLPILEASLTALDARDARWFAKNLPARDQWRAVPTFGERTAYVDIETNGGMEADDVTIIGLYDGFGSRIFVKGRDLDAFPAAIAEFDVLVTFFGTGFDLPMLRRRFPGLPLDTVHLDLCFALRRLGYKGGLKAIERELGIRRAFEIEDMSGLDAVHLWNAWERRGDSDALERLIAYNRADIENLASLQAIALPKLALATGFPDQSATISNQSTF
jgi:uncharacterized protein YprB with RNaseH-like and TPR domain